MDGCVAGFYKKSKRNEIESRAMNRYEIDMNRYETDICIDRTEYPSPTPLRPLTGGFPDKVPGTGAYDVTRYNPSPSGHCGEWSVRSSRDVDRS